MPGGGGGTGRGGGGGGNNSLWDTPCPGHLLQVSQEISIGSGQQLAIGGQQPSESTAEVGAADEGAEQGRCVCPDLVPDLLGGGPVGHAVQVGDVYHDSPNWEGLGQIPQQGGLQDEGGGNSVRKGEHTGIPPAGGRDDRYGTAGGRYLRIPPPEHSCTVYCDQDHYGPVSNGGAEAGVKGNQTVVGAGRIGCGGYVYGGLGGGTDGGGEEMDGTETETD